MNKTVKQLYEVKAKLEKELGYTNTIHHLTVLVEALENELPLEFEAWVADYVAYDPEYVGEEGLMRAYEDEDINEAYNKYVVEKFRGL